jgi:hypothetical protein
MRIALATVGTTGDVRPFAILARALTERGVAARALAGLIGAEDGIGASIALLERAAA